MVKTNLSTYQTEMVRPCLSSPVKLNFDIYGFILLNTGEAQTNHNVWSIAGLFGAWCGHTESWVSLGAPGADSPYDTLFFQLSYLTFCPRFLG